MGSTLAWAWRSSPASSSEAASSSRRRGCYGWWRREAPEQVRPLWGGRREDVQLCPGHMHHPNSSTHKAREHLWVCISLPSAMEIRPLWMHFCVQCCARAEELIYRALCWKGSAKSSIPLPWTANSKSHALRDQMCTHQKNNACPSQLLHGKA